jgi:choline transport protein
MYTHTNTKDAEMEIKGINDSATRTTSVDDELLQRLGHVQELRRDFSVWSLGSLCLCLMATWEALSSVVAAALTNGGAPCLFYN